MNSEARSENIGVGMEMMPPASKKMVESLKEIVNCTELEIYSALKDSNMDPNEAVNRLLSQDPFHQVKSKRDKKKENKDLPEKRFRVSSTSHRGSKSDRGRGGSAQFSSFDSSAFQGKLAYKKENGRNSYTTSVSVPQVAVDNPSWRPSAFSNSESMENQKLKRSIVGAISPSQTNSGYQSASAGVPGRNSVADIVKTGGTQGDAAKSLKPSQSSASDCFDRAPKSSEFHQEFSSSENQVLKVTDQYEKQVADPDEWPLFESPESVNSSSVLDSYAERTKLGPDQSYNFAYQNEEVKDGVVTSLLSETPNLQHLSIQEEERKPSYEKDGPSVVIPNHLQVQSADCKYLSFGSFRSVPTASGVARTFDTASTTQSDFLRQEYAEAEAAHGSQYNFSTESTEYPFQKAQQNIAFNYPQKSSWRQNLPFSDAMVYTDPFSSTQLAANIPVRDSELSYSPFPVAQSVASKNGNTVSSTNSLSISLEEALRTGLQSLHPTQQHLSGKRVASEQSDPQHLAAHQNSQPAHPFEPFANMNDYSYMPQNEMYMPSAFQQAYAGNGTYHQSLAADHPQYKSSVSVGRLPQSATVPAGYENFGESITLSGNYAMNPSVVRAGSTIGYDDLLSTRYKDNSYSIPLQQNENSAMWHNGDGSRTMSAVPASTYYSLQGQTQHPGGFGQGQQSSLNYGDANFYNSRPRMPYEQQLQSPRNGSLGGSYVQSKQPQQIWQNSY